MFIVKVTVDIPKGVNITCDVCGRPFPKSLQGETDIYVYIEKRVPSSYLCKDCVGRFTKINVPIYNESVLPKVKDEVTKGIIAANPLFRPVFTW